MNRITNNILAMTAPYTNSLGVNESDADMYAAIADAMRMNDNMRTHGTIDVPQVVTDAIKWVTDCRAGLSQRVYEDTAHACLGRVCVMLGLYGSKPESILSVIHSHGYETVTLADVEAVLKFVLEGV